jgi:hypothetical protein
MMRHTIWTGTCAAIVGVATAGILAQTTPQTATTQQSTPASSDNKITVTGCLKAAPQAGDTASAATTAGTTGTSTSAAAGTTGTTGTAGTTAAGTAGATAGTAGTTAGTQGAAGAAATDAKFILTGATASPADTATSAQTTYRLIANPTALTAHVGKKLELTGTIDTASAADPKDPSASAPALRVESGKVVAASCSE